VNAAEQLKFIHARRASPKVLSVHARADVQPGEFGASGFHHFTKGAVHVVDISGVVSVTKTPSGSASSTAR
jgi:hypothetical protein